MKKKVMSSVESKHACGAWADLGVCVCVWGGGGGGGGGALAL